MKVTQTSRVVDALKAWWCSYREMSNAAGTINAHRRALEWEDSHADSWRIQRLKFRDGWMRWRMRRV